MKELNYSSESNKQELIKQLENYEPNKVITVDQYTELKKYIDASDHYFFENCDGYKVATLQDVATVVYSKMKNIDDVMVKIKDNIIDNCNNVTDVFDDNLMLDYAQLKMEFNKYNNLFEKYTNMQSNNMFLIFDGYDLIIKDLTSEELKNYIDQFNFMILE